MTFSEVTYAKMPQRSSTVAQMSLVLNDLNRSDKYLRHLSFSPLTYNVEVTKLTSAPNWGEVFEPSPLRFFFRDS